MAIVTVQRIKPTTVVVTNNTLPLRSGLEFTKGQKGDAFSEQVGRFIGPQMPKSDPMKGGQNRETSQMSEI